MTETADCLSPYPLESSNMSTKEGKHYAKMTFHVGMKRSKSSTICFKLPLQKIKVVYLWNLTTYVKYPLGTYHIGNYFFQFLAAGVYQNTRHIARKIFI